jgi:hypothetical protein
MYAVRTGPATPLKRNSGPTSASTRKKTPSGLLWICTVITADKLHSFTIIQVAIQYTIVNRDFERAVKQLRQILPKLSFRLLIGTYIIRPDHRNFSYPAGIPTVIDRMLQPTIAQELDKELERRGLKFERYADDTSIFVGSRTSIGRDMQMDRRAT